MCEACYGQDAMIRRLLLTNPDERAKLTPEGADYYGFKRDAQTGQWVDAWAEGHADFRAEPVEQ